MSKNLSKVAVDSFSNGWLCGTICTVASFALYAFGIIHSVNKHTK